jgi:hypothetical protein
LKGEISNGCDVCGTTGVAAAVGYGPEIETKYCMDCLKVHEPELAEEIEAGGYNGIIDEPGVGDERTIH